MNLQNLSDDLLLTLTEKLVRDERELLTKVLHHLREIESRRLFSKLQYKSLFDYAVKHLKYSADQAARRIAAMRLLRDLPEIEAKIETGALTLTNLGLAQRVFRATEVSQSAGLLKAKKLSKTAKLKFVATIENLSSREAEKIALAQTPHLQKLIPDRTRVVAPTQVEIKFVAHPGLLEKIDRVKGLLAHKRPNCSLGELMETLCDLAIDKLIPKAKAPTKLKPVELQTELSSDSPAAPIRPRVTKTIPARVKRAVWRLAEDKCQNCASTFALEIDHIQPKALGGSNDPENLRLLCRSCNQRSAIEQLGPATMRPFLSGGQGPCGSHSAQLGQAELG